MPEKRCGKPAYLKCYWPGQTTHQCKEHWLKLFGLSRFMGFFLVSSDPDEGATCEQIVKESIPEKATSND